MKKIVTSSEMKEIERRTIEEIGIPSLVLMERAAMQVVSAIGDEEAVLVVCGVGNNDDILLPVRKTKCSAGYDFISFLDIVIKPGEIVKVPTGVKVKLNEDEYLSIYVRSSMGFKYNIRMCNQVGIVDK